MTALGVPRAYGAVWVPEDDRAFATRLARYCARNPVALERLTYDRAAKVVTYRSDKSEGPTAGTETADPLEFLARVLTHIPDKGHVTTRYYGWYANRPRGMRRQTDPAAADAPVPIVPAPRLAPTVATRRWAALGTLLNGQRVGSTVALQSGDVVQLGETGPEVEILIEGTNPR